MLNSQLIKIEGIGDEVTHYFGTADGWFFKATCGDDDYTVDLITYRNEYAGSLGAAPTLADSILAMHEYLDTHKGEFPPVWPPYRTVADGRRTA